MTNVTVTNDPVFFSEPQVRSNDFLRQPVDHGAWLYACDDGEQILDRAPDYVPHYLFGKQPFAREFATKYRPSLGREPDGRGVDLPRTSGTAARPARSPTSVLAGAGPALGDEPRRSIPSRSDGQVHVLRCETTCTCWSATAATSSSRPAIRDLRRRYGRGEAAGQGAGGDPDAQPEPIQFIANTSFHAEHTGGNDALGAAGQDPSLPGSFFVQSAPRGVTGLFSIPVHATMMGHNNVMVRMQAAGAPASAVPPDTYLEDRAAQVPQR